MESGSGMQILAQPEMQQFAVSRLERRGGESWEGICINPRNIYAKCKMEYMQQSKKHILVKGQKKLQHSFSFFLKQGVVNLLKWNYQHGDHRPHLQKAKSGVEESSVLVTIFLSAKLDTIVEFFHHAGSPMPRLPSRSAGGSWPRTSWWSCATSGPCHATSSCRTPGQTVREAFIVK